MSDDEYNHNDNNDVPVEEEYNGNGYTEENGHNEVNGNGDVDIQIPPAEEPQQQEEEARPSTPPQEEEEEPQREQTQYQSKKQQPSKQESPVDDTKQSTVEEEPTESLSVSHGHSKTSSIMSKPIPTNLTLDSAWKEICVDSPAINWYLFSVDKKMDLNFKGAGQRGFKEMADILKKSPTELLFGLLRINSNDKGGSRRAKFVYVRFIGSNVNIMQKAKITPKLGKIGDSFPVKHMTYDLNEDLGNFTIENISKEMLRVGGAHKPDSFDFGPDQVFYCK